MGKISLIKIDGVKKHFKSKISSQPVKAVDGVDLEIEEGQVLGLIGESGSGKSTLGKLILGLEEPTSGQILIDGLDSKKLLKKDRKAYYRRIQMIFQNPYDVFDENYTIYRSMADLLKIHGIEKKREREFLIKLLESASLSPAEDFLSRYPADLSGGQLQRIAVLRSMALSPDFIVADEPVTMLDVSVRSEIINLLLEAKKKRRTSLLFISHDIATTSFISDRLAVMYLGQIVEEANAKDLIENPAHPYTKTLLSYTNSIFSDKGKEKIKIETDPPKAKNLGERCYFSSRCYKAKERCFKEMPDLRTYDDGKKVRCFYYNG